MDPFQPSYRVSRERLLAGADALRGRFEVTIDSRTLAERGPDGEALALDFVVIGAPRPRHAVVVSSGTHGVEGYAGSAIQHDALAKIVPALELPEGGALILQHANNPWGFAWHRRVNENNVDCNRNFLEHFDRTRCSPDYEELFALLNPPDLEPGAEELRWRDIGRWIEHRGMRAFQQAVVEGQYKYAHALQFGGYRQQAGTRHLLDLVGEHLSGASSVIWLDIHTGLGAMGACELITGAANDSDSYRFSREVWGDTVKSATSGESISTPLNGVLDRGIEAALPAGCRFAVASPEYGTHSFDRVFRALRADNWRHHHASRGDAAGRAIENEMLEAFRPDNRDWERAVLDSGARLIAQALGALRRVPNA